MVLDAGKIHARLTAAGIPVDGVVNVDNTLVNLVVQFQQSATQQQRDAAAAIIAAYNQAAEDTKAANETGYIADIHTRWANSPLKGKTPVEIYTAVQGAIDGWGSLAAAKADLRVWLPLLFATLAWEVERDNFRNES